MADNLYDLSLSPAANLSVETIEEIQTATDKLPSPTLVPDAVSPEVGLVKGGKGLGGITDEDASSVRVHA